MATDDKTRRARRSDRAADASNDGAPQTHPGSGCRLGHGRSYGALPGDDASEPGEEDE